MGSFFDKFSKAALSIKDWSHINVFVVIYRLITFRIKLLSDIENRSADPLLVAGVTVIKYQDLLLSFDFVSVPEVEL